MTREMKELLLEKYEEKYEYSRTSGLVSTIVDYVCKVRSGDKLELVKKDIDDLLEEIDMIIG